MNQTVYILEKVDGDNTCDCYINWVVVGVVTKLSVAHGWMLEDKANRNYYEVVLDEID
jgi:hypothetical protein